LEIFNFFRKFVSNLQNELSGNSVILLNSSTTTAPPPALFLWPSSHARGRPWLHAGTGCSLRVVPSLSWPRYKAPTPLSSFLSLLCFPTPPPQLHRAPLASSAQASLDRAVSQLHLLLASLADLLLQLDFIGNSLSTFFFLTAGRTTVAFASP